MPEKLFWSNTCTTVTWRAFMSKKHSVGDMNVQETVNMQIKALQRALQVSLREMSVSTAHMSLPLSRNSHVALLFMQNWLFQLLPILYTSSFLYVQHYRTLAVCLILHFESFAHKNHPHQKSYSFMIYRLAERACKCFNVICGFNSFLAFLRHFCQTGCMQGWILWHFSQLSQGNLVIVTNSLLVLDWLKSDEMCTQS